MPIKAFKNKSQVFLTPVSKSKMLSSYVYWLAVLIGAVTVMWFVYSKKGIEIEPFVEAQPTPEEPTPEEPTPNSLYTEDMLTNANFPLASNVIYLSSFSDKVTYASAQDPSTNAEVYQSSGSTAKWHDMRAIPYDFTVHMSASNKHGIPDVVKKTNDIGLNLSGLKLYGPSSKLIGTSISSFAAYKLTSFTCVFYGVMDNVDFEEGETRKVLFRITAENPDLIEIAIRKRDNSNVILEIILGNASRSFQWPVNKFMLMSNRLPTAYTLVYDEGKRAPQVQPSATFYIGQTKLSKTFAAAEMAPQEEIRLGNTEVMLNPDGAVQIILIAFAYFNAPLTPIEIDNLGKYFEQKRSGIDVKVSAAKEEYTAIMIKLQKEIDDASRTLEDAETELTQCRAVTAEAKAAEPPKPHWQIETDALGIAKATLGMPADALKQCSSLSIKRLADTFGLTLPKLADPTKGETKTVTKPKAFRTVTTPPQETPTTTTTTTKTKTPPASLADPNASVWERWNDVLSA